jgi:hypothetical protein
MLKDSLTWESQINRLYPYHRTQRKMKKMLNLIADALMTLTLMGPQPKARKRGR